jgi:hypothetical protein
MTLRDDSFFGPRIERRARAKHKLLAAMARDGVPIEEHMLRVGDWAVVPTKDGQRFRILLWAGVKRLVRMIYGKDNGLGGRRFPNTNGRGKGGV